MLVSNSISKLWRRGLPLLTTVTLLVAGSTVQAQWGDVEGQIILDGAIPVLANKVTKGDATAKDCNDHDVPDYTLAVNPANNGVAHVFIYMKKKPSKIHPDLAKSAEKELIVDQKGCVFAPYSLIVRTDQTVTVKSDDPFPHNTHGYMLFNKQFNITIAASDREGQSVPASSLGKQELLPCAVKCDVHSHMESWWLITDHPYNAITDADGKFSIKNLPAGEHTFSVWHSRVGYINKELTVKVASGKATDAGVISVPAEKFEKK